MTPCKCGSYAINPSLHGRDGTDRESCDVCFWRNRAGSYESDLRSIIAIALAAEKSLKLRPQEPSTIGIPLDLQHELRSLGRWLEDSKQSHIKLP